MLPITELRRIAFKARADSAGARRDYLQLAAALLHAPFQSGESSVGRPGQSDAAIRLSRAAIISAESLDYPIKEFEGKGPGAVAMPSKCLSGAAIIAEPRSSMVGFVHVAMMGGWRQILDELLVELRHSHLDSRVEKIVLSCVGDAVSLPAIADGRIQIIHSSTDLSRLESPTLELLRAWSVTNDGVAFYAHTKGVHSGEGNPTVHDWRRYMAHFVLGEHEKCLSALASHDLVGVNWQTKPWPHFSGNFWWARSSYVRTLPELDVWQGLCGDVRACERWIGANPSARIACLHQSLENHYLSPYPSHRYVSPHHHPDIGGPASDDQSSGIHDRVENLLCTHLQDVWPITVVVLLAHDTGAALRSWSSIFPRTKIIAIDSFGLSKSPPVEMKEAPGPSPEQWKRFPDNGAPDAFWMTATHQEIASQFAYPVDVLQMDSALQYDELKKVFALWEPKVRADGCVLFFDLHRYPRDIGRLFSELKGQKRYVDFDAGIGIWHKPHASQLPLYPVQHSNGERERLLSVLIPTLPSRKATLSKLLEKLDLQRTQADLTSAVEILVFEDNKELSVGKKRNLLMGRATGQFVVFIDDDDDIDERYLATLCEIILKEQGIDCIGFQGELQLQDLPPEPTIYSLRYTAPADLGDTPGYRVFLRPPQHLNPIRLEIALQYPFPDVTCYEDCIRSSELARSGALQCEYFIADRIMYTYLFSPMTTETQGHCEDSRLKPLIET